MDTHTMRSYELETILGHLSQLTGDALEAKLVEFAGNYHDQGATPELLRDMLAEYMLPKPLFRQRG